MEILVGDFNPARRPNLNKLRERTPELNGVKKRLITLNNRDVAALHRLQELIIPTQLIN